MKKMIRSHLHRCILLILPVLFCAQALSAQDSIRISLKDGTIVQLGLSELRKITFDVQSSLQQHPQLTQQLLKLRLIPNPSVNYSNVDYELDDAGEVSIKVFALDGKLIHDRSIGFQEKGKYTYYLDTSKWKAGSYYCKLMQGQHQFVSKLIVKR